MSRQLSEDDYLRLIRELVQVLPLSIAMRLQECAGLSYTTFTPHCKSAIEEDYLRLRQAIMGTKQKPGIVQLLSAIQRDCHQALVTREVLCKTARARRPNQNTLLRAICLPGNLSAKGKMERIFDLSVERSFDTYENRLVKTYIHIVHSRMAKLQAAMENTDSEVKNDLETVFNEFRLACSSARFLNQTKLLPVISLSQITMPLLMKPAYRAMLEGYMELSRQPPLRLEEPALRTPQEQLPYLYKLWATLKVVDVLLRICAKSGYRCLSQQLLKKDDNGLLMQIIANRKPALLLHSGGTGAIVRLMLDRSYGAKGYLRGSNQELCASLAVEVFTPAGQTYVVLFDPAFNVSSEEDFDPLKEDIDKMLMCLDEITTEKGVRAVQYGAILYPGHRKRFAPRLEALPARPSVGTDLDDIIQDVLERFLTI